MPITQLVTRADTHPPEDGNPTYRDLTDSELRVFGGTDDHDERRAGNQMQTTYEGRVLATYEKNGYNDSDFYAIVETDEPGKFTTIEYASTRGWTYLNGATVDATDDVLGRYKAFRKGLADQAQARREAQDKRRLAKDATVRVTTGKHKDIEGTVGWLGEDQFKNRKDYSGFGIRHLDDYRVGIRTAGAKKLMFVGAQQVEILVDGQWVEPEVPGTTVEDVAYGFGADTWRAPQVTREANA